MAVLKVHNGSSFITAIGKTYNGTAWVEKMNFHNGSAFVELYPTGPAVSANTSAIIYTLFSAGTCYATVRFGLDGIEYKNGGATDTGHSTSRGTWLDAGLNSEVWINRIINSGTLNRFDAGAGRKVMTSDRVYGISKSTNGTKTTNMTFEFWDAASGGNLLDTVTYDLKATIDSL